MKKNDKLHISIATLDKQKIKHRAESLGLTLSQYCLFVLLSTKPKIPN